jgi:hypothetical protein
MRVMVRGGPLDVEVSGGSAEELVRVAGRLKREVLDAYPLRSRPGILGTVWRLPDGDGS